MNSNLKGSDFQSTSVDLNDSSKTRRIQSFAKYLDLSTSILGIALILTLIGRFLSYSDDPISNAQFSQAIFGCVLLYLGVTRKSSKLLRDRVERRKFKRVIALFPIIAFLVFLPYRLTITDLDSYARRISEGSLVEWLTFIFLLFSGILFIISSKSGYKLLGKNIAMIIGIGCLIVAMEEMSWGQMIFNWETPDIFNTTNIQHETNIHNLALFHHSTWTIAAAVFSLLTVLSLCRWWLERRIEIAPQSPLDIILPPSYLIGYFTIAALIYIGIVFEKGGTDIPMLITREQEIAECLFSLGILINASRTYINWGDNRKVKAKNLN